jgi:hypothetical protein
VSEAAKTFGKSHFAMAIGAVYDSRRASYMSLLFLPQSFDVLIHIQKVTASHLLPLPT